MPMKDSEPLKKHTFVTDYRTINQTSSSSSAAASIQPNSSASSTLETLDNEEPCSLSAFWRHLDTEVDLEQVNAPLSAYSFMTGYIDGISFSAIFVWCGFQTGNFAQLALALARLLESPLPTDLLVQSTRFTRTEQQSLCSLLAFCLGALVFGRLGDRIGNHKRRWLFIGTLTQALLTLASASAFLHAEGTSPIAGSRDHPVWASTRTFYVIAFLSCSLGVQGIMAKRLNTSFSTTIVLTTAFVELVSDSQLFTTRRRVPARDQKFMAAGSLFLGVVAGRLILGQLGTALTLVVAASLRILIAISWLLVPEKPLSLPI